MKWGFDIGFWVILGVFYTIVLIGAETPTTKEIVAHIWLAAISAIFVVKASTEKILTALKEHIDKKEN